MEGMPSVPRRGVLRLCQADSSALDIAPASPISISARLLPSSPLKVCHHFQSSGLTGDSQEAGKKVLMFKPIILITFFFQHCDRSVPVSESFFFYSLSTIEFKFIQEG